MNKTIKIVFLAVTVSSVLFLAVFLQSRKARYETYVIPHKDFVDPDRESSSERFALADNVYYFNEQKEPFTLVAVILGVTTRGRKITDINLKQEAVFFTQLVKSFCQTASLGFQYSFYVGYDSVDEYLQTSVHVQHFKNVFRESISENCSPMIPVYIRMVRVPYTKRVSWSMNDAALEAYLDGADYYYRVNDDTQFLTPKWTEVFIATLSAYDPPNVGVVAPNHMGDWQAVLQYDFTHRTHLDMFGYYYPRFFADWKVTDWITHSYERIKRLKRLQYIKLRHSESVGRRYTPVDASMPMNIYNQILDSTNTVLKHYLNSLSRATMNPHNKRKNVIAFSVDVVDEIQIFGLVRNVLMAKVNFPEWSVRVYIHPEKGMPLRVKNILARCGTQVVIVKELPNQYNYTFWKYAVMMDKSIERFIIRDTRTRLGPREADLTQKWILSKKPFFLVKNHHHNDSQGLLKSILFGGITVKSASFPSRVSDLYGFVMGGWTKSIGDILLMTCDDMAKTTSPCGLKMAQTLDLNYTIGDYYGNLGQFYDKHELPMDNLK